MNKLHHLIRAKPNGVVVIIRFSVMVVFVVVVTFSERRKGRSNCRRRCPYPPCSPSFASSLFVAHDGRSPRAPGQGGKPHVLVTPRVVAPIVQLVQSAWVGVCFDNRSHTMNTVKSAGNTRSSFLASHPSRLLFFFLPNSLPNSPPHSTSFLPPSHRAQPAP